MFQYAHFDANFAPGRQGGGLVILAEREEDHSPKKRPTFVISIQPLLHILPAVLGLITAFKLSLYPR